MNDFIADTVAESEERFRSIFMTSPNGMAIVELGGRFLRVNLTLCEITGYSETELLSKTSQEITHSDDIEKDQSLKKKLLAGEINHYRLEKRYRHKKGHYIWIYVSSTLVRDSNGQPLYRVAEIEDITQRKKNEAELEKYRNQLEELIKERTQRLEDSEVRIRTIMNSMLDGLITIDAGGVIEEVNPAAEQIFGYSSDELVGREISLLMPEPYASNHHNNVKRYLETGETHLIGNVREFIAKKKDGSLLPVDIAVSEAIVAGKRLFSGIVRDISKRKKSEERLRTLALVVQEMENIVAIFDKEGLITWVNPAFATVTGYTLTEVVGKRSGEVLHGPETNPETVRAMQAAIRENRTLRTEILNYAKGGRKYWVEINLQPVFDSNFELTHYIVVASEITERRNIEHQRTINERNSNLLKVVAEAANASRSPEEVFRVVVDSISQYANWPVGHAYELDDAGKLLIDSGIWHVADSLNYHDFIKISERTYFSVGEGLPGMVMQEQKAKWLENIMENQLFLRTAAAMEVGLKTAVAFPVIVKDKVVAVLEFFSPEIQSKDESLLELMQQIGIQIGIVIERTGTERSLMKLFRAVENSPATVIITDQTGAIEYANPRFEQISGYTAAEAIGKNPRILKSGLQTEEFYSDLWTTLLGGSEWRGEFCNRKKNGELYWESASISPVRDETGVITNFVAVKEDITAQKQSMIELEQARDAADSANRFKGEFLANMSHEIRTPLNAILGFSTLAQKQELSPVLLDYIMKIHSAGMLLLGVVNDILDFSKIEAGKLEIEKTRFKLDEVLTSVTSVVQQRAIDNGIELLLNVSPGLYAQYIGDPLRLGQILTNLLGNAIKFTHQGEVELSVAALQVKSDRIQLKFSVRDTGIGMAKEQIANLFQAFTQADGSTTRKYGGTGLGLSICKRLVEMMEGEIWAESELGKGSVFHFNVWLGQYEKESRHNLPRHLVNTNVLIADDNRASRKVLNAILSQLSSNVDTVDSGYAALSAVRDRDATNPYQLVLMDWHMPDLDGIEATRLIKEDRALTSKPSIVVITAFGRDEEEREAYAAGADGYLRKPITASILVDEVVRIFDPINRATEKVNEVKRESTYDFSGNRILMAEDNEVNQQIITELLRETGAQIDIANNGREALEKILADEVHYDLILMDIQMPEMDGEQAARLIRGNEKSRDIPIIAMTAHVLIEERIKILASGMNDVITKPIDPDILCETLGKYLQHATSEDWTKRDHEESLLLIGNSSLDVQGSLRRAGGSMKLYIQMLRKFWKNHQHAPLEIEKALKAQDLELARRIAHTVNGVAGNLGAIGVHHAATELENNIAVRAGFEFIQLSLQHFTSEMIVLGDYLSSSLPEPDARSKTDPSQEIDRESIAGILSELFSYVEKSDGAAEDYFKENQVELEGLAREDLLHLETSLSNYDYETAREILLVLAEQLNIQLGFQEERHGQ